MRINEVFGDIVNWDFIPQNAINSLTLYPSNPVFGLNATGGALSFDMKNGFTYHGVEGEVSGGSYGRIGTSIQAGGQVGNLSGYVTADAINNAGWREDSPSTLRRVYADLGARGDNNTEFHVTFTGADNTFGAAAATPVQLLNQNWSSIYTVPQTTHNQLDRRDVARGLVDEKPAAYDKRERIGVDGPNSLVVANCTSPWSTSPLQLG